MPPSCSLLDVVRLYSEQKELSQGEGRELQGCFVLDELVLE